MTYLLLESIFFGFAIFILLTGVFFPFLKENTKANLNQLILSAVVLTRTAGIFYLLYWGISILVTFVAYTPTHNDDYVLINRMFGPYWLWYWIMVLAFGMSQLLWFRFAQTNYFRIPYALFVLFVLSIEKITILLTSFHRDFVPGGWRQVFTIEFLSATWVMQLSIFTLFLLVTQLVREKNKHKI